MSSGDRDYTLTASFGGEIEKFAKSAQKARQALNELAPAATSAATALDKLTGSSTTAAAALGQVAPAARSAAAGARELTKAAEGVGTSSRPAAQLADALGKVADKAKEAAIEVKGVGGGDGPQRRGPNPRRGQGAASVPYSNNPNAFLASGDPMAFMEAEAARMEKEKSGPTRTAPPVITDRQARMDAARAERQAARETQQAAAEATKLAKEKAKQEREAAFALERQQKLRTQELSSLVSGFAGGFGAGSVISGFQTLTGIVKSYAIEIGRLKSQGQQFGIGLSGYASIENSFRMSGSSNAEGTTLSTLSALRQSRADALVDPHAASDFAKLGISAKEFQNLNLDQLLQRLAPAIRDSTKDASQFAAAVRLLGEANVGEIVAGMNSPIQKQGKLGKFLTGLVLGIGNTIDPTGQLGSKAVGSFFGQGEYTPPSLYNERLKEQAYGLHKQNDLDETYAHIGKTASYNQRIGELETFKSHFSNPTNPVEEQEFRRKRFALDQEIEQLRMEQAKAVASRPRAALNNVNSLQAVGLYRGGMPDPGVVIQKEILAYIKREAAATERLAQAMEKYQ